jgi:hypothetical protein
MRETSTHELLPPVLAVLFRQVSPEGSTSTTTAIPRWLTYPSYAPDTLKLTLLIEAIRHNRREGDSFLCRLVQ